MTRPGLFVTRINQLHADLASTEVLRDGDRVRKAKSNLEAEELNWRHSTSIGKKRAK